MKKFNVTLNARGSATYTVEAKTPEEAYKLVSDNDADLHDVEIADWDFDCPGEIHEEGTENYTNIEDLP